MPQDQDKDQLTNKKQGKAEEEDQSMPTVQRARSANPFEQEADESQKEKNAETDKSNPTLENLTGEAPREEKLDRKETLRRFLKENRQHKEESETEK